MGKFASSGVRLKCHNKKVVPFKQPKSNLIIHSITNFKLFTSTSTTTTTKLSPTRRYHLPTTTNPPLNAPPLSSTRNILKKTPLSIPTLFPPIHNTSSTMNLNFCLSTRFHTKIIPSSCIAIPLLSSMLSSSIFSRMLQEVQQSELCSILVATSKGRGNHLAFFKEKSPTFEYI